MLARFRKTIQLSAIIAVCLTCTANTGIVSAISQDDYDSVVNGTPFYDPNAIDCGATTTSNTLVGSGNIQKAYNFFVGQGLNNVQAAAVVGNLDDESALNPTIVQNGGNSNNPADAGSGGWGIAQWTPGAKITGIQQQLGVTGNIDDLGTQLQIVWKEMTGSSPTGYSNIVKDLKQYTTQAQLSAAVSFFQVNFEGGVAGQRQSDAQQIFSQYGNSGSNSGSNANAPVAASCAANTVACTGGGSAGGNVATTSLSPTRQKVVCTIQQELATWQKQPGYPWQGSNHFSETYYLKYTQGRAEEWCADFASWAYNQAGYPFTGGNGGWDLPAVASIQALGQQNHSFHWHGPGYTPKPGDLAIHGGNHVNIFVSSSGGLATYIGGDQGNGPYPGGSVVSTEIGHGYYDNGITGYVSPD